MGLLEDILQRAQWMPGAGGFPAIAPPVDEAAQAAAAREAAGQKLALANRRRPPNPLTLAPDEQAPGVQYALGNTAPAIPFSTQAGMLAPPVTVGGAPDVPPEAPPEAVPLPMARPPEADLPPATDVTSRGRNAPPLQIAPPVIPDAQAATPAVPQDAGMFSGGLPGILGKIRTTLGDNSNTLLALGAGFAGAPNIGQGISRAAAAAIPARAADIKQKLALQTQGVGYQALVQAGVPKNLAIAAMGNPDIMKSVVTNYLSDRKKEIHEGPTDKYGNKTQVLFDPFSGKVTALDGTALPSAAQAADTAATTDVTGPDYMEKLKGEDPAYARQVQQVIDGDAPMPTGRQALTPMGQRLRRDVLTVEPGSSDSDFATRNMVRKSYSGGNDSKVTKSINTTLEHAQRLEKSIKRLDNFNFLPSVTNPVRNLVKGETSEDYQKARGAYETDVANFAKELDFAVSGGRPTVSGTKHQMEGFKLGAPQSEQMEKLKEGVELLKGRLDSHATGYGKGMKKNVEGIDFINAPNRDFYKRFVDEQAQPTGAPVPGVKASPPQAAAPAVAPDNEPIAINKTTGAKMVFRGGQWQPLQ